MATSLKSLGNITTKNNYYYTLEVYLNSRIGSKTNITVVTYLEPQGTTFKTYACKDTIYVDGQKQPTPLDAQISCTEAKQINSWNLEIEHWETKEIEISSSFWCTSGTYSAGEASRSFKVTLPIQSSYIKYNKNNYGINDTVTVTWDAPTGIEPDGYQVYLFRNNKDDDYKQIGRVSKDTFEYTFPKTLADMGCQIDDYVYTLVRAYKDSGAVLDRYAESFAYVQDENFVQISINGSAFVKVPAHISVNGSEFIKINKDIFKVIN